MTKHHALPGTKFCQDCHLWLPAIDVCPAWSECPRDLHVMGNTSAVAHTNDPSLEARIRATDSKEKPAPEDYERWNASLFELRAGIELPGGHHG